MASVCHLVSISRKNGVKRLFDRERDRGVVCNEDNSDGRYIFLRDGELLFNRERKVIQNPLAPERGAAPEALPQAPAPTEVAHPAVRALYGNYLN